MGHRVLAFGLNAEGLFYTARILPRQIADKRKHTPGGRKGCAGDSMLGVVIRIRATEYRLVIPAGTVYWPVVQVY